MIIDIRETNELLSERIKEAVHLPLSNRDNIDAFINSTSDKIVIMCRSGKRASILFNDLTEAQKEKCEVYNGGIIKYSQENKTLKNYKANDSIPIMRQVLIVAGSLSLSLIALGLSTGNNTFTTVAGLVASGLLFSGLTGNCMMASLLSKAWWNN